MKCPFCGKEMRVGYLQGFKGVGFSEKIHNSLALWMFKGDFGKKTKDWTPCTPRGYNHITAYYCDDCECVLSKKSIERKD